MIAHVESLPNGRGQWRALLSTSPDQTEETRTGVAYHESGHAVVGACLGYRLKDVNLRHLETAAVDQSGDCSFVDDQSSWKTRDYLTVLWAGYISELTLRKARGWDERPAERGRQVDIQLMGERIGEINAASFNRLHDAKSRSEKLVYQHWQAIETLAEVLLRDECVDGETAHAIIGL